MERLDSCLHLVADTLATLEDVQASWLALHGVMAAPDIVRQLPAEAATFTAADKAFRSFMRAAHDRPAALPILTASGTLNTLREARSALESVAAGLATYLEGKRAAFPRCGWMYTHHVTCLIEAK